MPYSLKGNSVVKSDSGEVVKTHPSREKALAHLRALKANVEEGSPGVLAALLEGAFDEARHPRDFRGRFKAGDHVTLQHGMFGKVPARVTKVTASRVHVTSSDSRVSDTSMTHNQAAVKLEHMIGPHAVRPRLAKGQTANEMRGGIPTVKYDSLGQAARAGALPSQRDKTGRPTGRKYDSIGAAARAGALPSQQPGSAPPPLPANAPERRASPDRHGGFKIGDVVTHETGSREAGGHGPVTFTKQPGLSTVVGLQRNGNLRLKHPETGTTHDVHHSHAQKVGPLHPDYRGKVVQDAYAAQRAELARQAADRARRSGRALGESAPGVLGVLLEGR